MLESSDMLVLATRHWHRAKYANSVVAGPTKIKTCCFFFCKWPTTLALALQLLSLKISILGTNHRSLTLPGIITYASCPRPHPGAWWGAWHPPKLQSHRGASKQPKENEGTHSTPNHWICWRPAFLHKSDRTAEMTSASAALGKKPAKVQLLLHIIVRKEGLSLLRNKKAKVQNTFFKLITYITI